MDSKVFFEDELELSEDTIKELEEAKKEIEKEEYFSLEDVEKMLSIEKHKT